MLPDPKEGLDINPDRWPDVSRVFSAAATLDGPSRNAYLDDACRHDPALRAAVESLLGAHDHAGSFGEAPVFVAHASVRRLTPESQLGPFRIETLLGAGGMGEVYRAYDTKLHRAVAIKVLPDSLAKDPNRLARFEEEARALAALNHPHVGAIYGVEESAGVAALVLELIEGPTLAERLGAGPLAFDEVVRIAQQLAEGLEAAHKRGIIHRDLKPGNIKVTPDGNAKILDFGLAKTAGAAPGAAFTPSTTGSREATQFGVVLGTVGYMSPEQARGEPVDQRTDIWAYGCVLFEMCAGHPPFAGATVGETLTAVVEREPDWKRLRAGTPPNLVRVLRRCLTRDPTLRLHDMEEARIALEGARPVASGPERVTWTTALTSWPALSSDARLIAYVSDAGQDGETPQIWIQPIRGAAMRLTNGDCEYSHLAFSHDDTQVVFTASDDSGPSVYEVPALGGEARLLQRGASRGRVAPDGRWFACVPQDAVGIRISARGAADARTVAASMVDVACLTWSPDSRSVLVHARNGPAVEPDWWIVPIDGGSPINSGVAQRFREAGMFPLPTGLAWIDDSLVLSAAGIQGVNLYRQRIAAASFQATGAPERLTASNESAWLPTAAAGRLAYFSGRADGNLWSVALDATSGVASGPQRRMTRGTLPLGYLTLSGDFRTLVYFSYRLGTGDVFLRDLRTGSERLLSEGPVGAKGYPAISPSGHLLAHGMKMQGAGRALRPIFIVSLHNGSWRSLGDDCGGRPREWVDERALIIERFARLNSVALIDTDTGEQCELLESSERSVSNPRLSPDRRWIAFDAARPGRPTGVFVSPFQQQRIPESAWTEVDRSASHPFWSADGRFLFYTPIGTNPSVRSAVRARHFASPSGLVSGQPFEVYRSTEMLMPAYLPGTAPIATPDQIVFVLGDFRGDVWLMDLDP